MNDRAETLTADELELEANRARERLGSTIDALLGNLRPKRLVSEWARGSGLDDVASAKTLEFAYRHHPVATTLCGVGLGFLAYVATRHAVASSPQKRPIGRGIADVFGRLTESAASVVRERSHQNSERLLKLAETKVASTTHEVSAAVERSVEQWLANLPGPPAARPLLAAAAQILMAAVVESALRKREFTGEGETRRERASASASRDGLEQWRERAGGRPSL
jgi:hypothetical protein